MGSAGCRPRGPFPDRGACWTRRSRTGRTPQPPAQHAMKISTFFVASSPGGTARPSHAAVDPPPWRARRRRRVRQPLLSDQGRQDRSHARLRAALGDLQRLCRGLDGRPGLARLAPSHFELPPTEEKVVPRPWWKPHRPNLTGTPAAHRPTGSTLAQGRRPRRPATTRRGRRGADAPPPSLRGLRSRPKQSRSCGTRLLRSLAMTGGSLRGARQRDEQSPPQSVERDCFVAFGSSQ